MVVVSKSSGLLFGKVPERIKISENGYKFWVDVMGGQKTGFFLDQRDKRQALAKYAEDKKVSLTVFHIHWRL
jgi:23S rRNA (cytosine1962-C5)-methyltransferase